jgi:hypothetical protein
MKVAPSAAARRNDATVFSRYGIPADVSTELAPILQQVEEPACPPILRTEAASPNREAYSQDSKMLVADEGGKPRLPSVSPDCHHLAIWIQKGSWLAHLCSTKEELRSSVTKHGWQ